MRVVLCQRKNGLPSFLALSMKPLRVFDQDFVEGLHVVLGALGACLPVLVVGRMFLNGRSGPSSTIFCLPTLPQRGISVGSSLSVAQAVHQVARPVLVEEGRVRGEGVPERVRHGVEVVQVAEELVEAVQRRQELVQVAEVVLAELPGGIPLTPSARWRWCRLAPACRRPHRPGPRSSAPYGGESRP